MQQGDDTIREDGATVREGGATVREGGATVREGGATVREEVEPSSPSATSSQEEQTLGWLPPVLAAEYSVVESLPARGGEADLYVVSSHDAQYETRFVAKVYRQGIAPKEDVLGLVQQADPAHVVRLEAYGQDAGRWWELMEYAEQGSLRQLLEREGTQLPEALIRDILLQLNNALASVHQRQLEHRDLKPGNVLVRSRTPLDLVLTDFGIASVLESTMHFTGTAQTVKYAPPEAHVGTGTVVIERTKWDYWSLGMMLVEMLVGKHPYEDLSGAIIGNRILTESVEGLTEEVADPAWRKLGRGLLRRTPADRWDGAAVSKWLADPNDSSLSVAEEAAAPQPTVEAPPTPTIDFDGGRYATPEELGLALAEDWAKAESFWMRRFPDVRNWVTDGLGLQSLGDAMAAIDDDDIPLETQVFNFVYLLAPNAPTVRFRNVELSIEGLAELGQWAVTGQDADARSTLRTSYDVAVERSMGAGQDADARTTLRTSYDVAVERSMGAGQDADARTTLLTLYRQRILMLAGSLPGKEALAEVSRRWDDAVSDYERLRAEFGAQEVTVPELDDDVLVVLLAGGIPVPAVLATLRQEAQRASTRAARACPWFRALGTPEDMSVAALAMLPHLQAPAERQSRTRRTRSLRGCVWGSVVGGLFGLHVIWAHVLLILGHYSAPVYHFFITTISMAGMTFAFYRAVVWDLRGPEDRAQEGRAQEGAQEDRAQTTGRRERISDGMGCLILIALPFAAILMIAAFVLLLFVVALPSLLAMDMIGLIYFEPPRLGGDHYQDFLRYILKGSEDFFNSFFTLFNPLLYVVPHALLGAVVGFWARRRGVITISILVFLALVAVVNLANPTHFLALLG